MLIKQSCLFFFQKFSYSAQKKTLQQSWFTLHYIKMLNLHSFQFFVFKTLHITTIYTAVLPPPPPKQHNVNAYHASTTRERSSMTWRIIALVKYKLAFYFLLIYHKNGLLLFMLSFRQEDIYYSSHSWFSVHFLCSSDVHLYCKNELSSI